MAYVSIKKIKWYKIYYLIKGFVINNERAHTSNNSFNN